MFATRPARILLLALLLAPALAAQIPSASDPPRYALPPKDIVDAFDAPLPPTVTVSPSRQVLALESHRAHPTIAELAQPMLRLAGFRVNPKTNGPRLAGNVYAITLRRIADGVEMKVNLPPQPNVSNVQFSADDLKRAMRKSVEKALRDQKLTIDESRVLLKFYENGLEGYTYLE